MEPFPILEEPRLLRTSAGRGWNGISAELVRIPAGRSESAGRDSHMLGVHFGPPVHASCMVDDQQERFVQRAGDIGLVPACMRGTWEDDGPIELLRITLRPSLLVEVAEQLGRDPAKIELIPHFQLRDRRLHAIAQAIKVDLEDVTPSDPLYSDLVANTLAVRLIEVATDRYPRIYASGPSRMSPRQLKTITEFIESNLAEKLSLVELATIAGLSATHLKTMFRSSTGTPVHRYVIGRRVERARHLLSTTRMPASQIAIACGFSHQSHMVSTMRRFLGCTPSGIDRPSD